MSLPLTRPLLPMEALAVSEIPQGAEWQYEPKWDGFRCIAFRDGKNVDLQSKAGQPLSRYFPEIVKALGALLPPRFVLDGELVIPHGKDLSFDDLLQRIHPAASRIKRLSEETPATFILFDLLVDSKGKAVVQKPLKERRKHLEDFARTALKNQLSIRLSPATTKASEAQRWFESVGGGLDGLIAKNREAAYEPGERSGMIQKIKRLRSADCVVGGFRYASKGKVVGSLLLGLYDAKGLLHHVGFTSSIQAAERPDLTKKLEKLIQPPGFTGQAPGGPSRWSTERSTQWQPLAPKLIAEVQYDHFTGGRFRHGTKLLRWRPDKSAKQCTLKQVEQEARTPLLLLK